MLPARDRFNAGQWWRQSSRQVVSNQPAHSSVLPSVCRRVAVARLFSISTSRSGSGSHAAHQRFTRARPEDRRVLDAIIDGEITRRRPAIQPELIRISCVRDPGEGPPTRGISHPGILPREAPGIAIVGGGTFHFASAFIAVSSSRKPDEATVVTQSRNCTYDTVRYGMICVYI